jgi:hypothetical protein
VVTVRLIGYWRSDLEPEWPDPRDFVDASWDQSDRHAAARCLDAVGFEPWAQCGFSECRFCGALNGSVERCDGVYIWPEGLAHYIREHDVRLPAEVVGHILSAAHSSDQHALRRLEAAVRESHHELVVDEDFWTHAKLG